MFDYQSTRHPRINHFLAALNHTPAVNYNWTRHCIELRVESGELVPVSDVSNTLSSSQRIGSRTNVLQNREMLTHVLGPNGIVGDDSCASLP